METIVVKRAGKTKKVEMDKLMEVLERMVVLQSFSSLHSCLVLGKETCRQTIKTIL